MSIRTPKLVPRTTKPKRLLAGILAGKTVEQSALDAGYSPTTARQQTELMKTLRAQYVCYLADMITPREMAEVVALGIKASRPDTFYDQRKGQVVESREFAEHLPRTKYLELAAKILGLLVRREEISGTGPNGEIQLAHSIELARRRVADARAESGGDCQVVDCQQLADKCV